MAALSLYTARVGSTGGNFNHPPAMHDPNRQWPTLQGGIVSADLNSGPSPMYPKCKYPSHPVHFDYNHIDENFDRKALARILSANQNQTPVARSQISNTTIPSPDSPSSSLQPNCRGTRRTPIAEIRRALNLRTVRHAECTSGTETLRKIRTKNTAIPISSSSAPGERTKRMVTVGSAGERTKETALALLSVPHKKRRRTDQDRETSQDRHARGI
ncbi:hypothetical protein QBC44DRAFT_313627 [Cladorrhinum sp. PSN332]|nr:hypothetical protein QBC44DRAFT_313627 [Cladorrhinum sp. PSN332]